MLWEGLKYVSGSRIDAAVWHVKLLCVSSESRPPKRLAACVLKGDEPAAKALPAGEQRDPSIARELEELHIPCRSGQLRPSDSPVRSIEDPVTGSKTALQMKSLWNACKHRRCFMCCDGPAVVR